MNRLTDETLHKCAVYVQIYRVQTVQTIIMQRAVFVDFVQESKKMICVWGARSILYNFHSVHYIATLDFSGFWFEVKNFSSNRTSVRC